MTKYMVFEPVLFSLFIDLWDIPSAFDADRWEGTKDGEQSQEKYNRYYSYP
ncbi:MAG: hypothetical protein ACLR71_18725 [[Clostridium] scindens]